MYLQEETKRSLESIIGKPLNEVSEMNFDEEVCYVETVTKRPLDFSKKTDSRMTGRGNPLITRRRIMTMKDVDKRISEMKYVCNCKNR